MRTAIFILLLPLFSGSASAQTDTGDLSADMLYNLIGMDASLRNTSIEYLNEHWTDEYMAPLVDLLFVADRVKSSREILKLLKDHTDERVKDDPYSWWQWLWEKEENYGAYYADLKADVFRNVDPKFYRYFKGRQKERSIRLDEILWGGVAQDGIPPLRDPDLVPIDEAGYLFKDDIVFGIEINGVARAYPKRILGWHEMVVDNIGGRRVAGVYCTLCGTMIAYDTEYEGRHHDLGTSGFLYRSNKLMYDKHTQSLWNTIEGKPVVGPLTKDSIVLKTYPVITTTWGSWKKMHPDTKVLSYNTGYVRDYAPGAAYRRYYATDQLMFPVPATDSRLSNKKEVLVVRSNGYEEDPLAISIDFLKRNRIYHDAIAGQNLVIITGKKEGSRVYACDDILFDSYKKGVLKDQTGVEWQMSEDYLENPLGQRLTRLPSHNIFWFAWYNTYPDTRLVK